ncbi:enoyl-CoA hydratase/isomerase family protein [Solimonas marina]|uniref:Enoyl-CoA hydratase/isomerase family protein n=1 Tax=Solimonas marina TaxID=2714601 RepID=A0A969WBK8_9GAMM|nr:enoyl-CoA hydratase-related protein [Solimonas marina]NKF23548.1 enoyl-CoA hydratase/isomerase family protein [Solimonas marina]
MDAATIELPACTTLELALDDGVLRVTLNRPDARNAMNLQMVEELCTLFAALQDDAALRGSVRVVVLRGAGGHFCAGADLKSLAGAAPADGGDPLAALNRRFGTMLRAVEAAPAVVVAVCEGAVLGGGFGIACVADITLAASDARFGLPETTRGLPPAQIAPFVAARIGTSQARRLSLTGAQFDGLEALRLGVAHGAYASGVPLDAALGDSIAAILRCAPQANALTKRLLLNPDGLDLDAQLDDAAATFAQCARSSEAAEGIAAFMQKRAPAWAPPPRPKQVQT